MEPPSPETVNEEIIALIATLHRTGERLEELTAGEVDTVADSEGRTFLLRRPQEQLRQIEALRQSANIAARQEAEDAMRHSEQRFSGAFEHAPIGVTLVSTQGRFLKANRAMCELTGYSEAELTNKSFQEITHPDDREVGLENVRQMRAGELQAYQIEKRYIHKSGHTVPVLLNVSLVRDGSGRPSYFIAHIKDITERKRSESATAKTLQRLNEAQRIAKVGDWEWDLATQLITWSPQVYEIVGRDLALGAPTFEEHASLYEAASTALLREKVALALSTGEPQEYELVLARREGVTIHTKAVAVPRKDEDGRVVGLYGTLQDISERKRSEAALLGSDERYRLLFESMLEGYAYCSTSFEQGRLTDFTYVEVNSSFEKLTGLKDVVGKRVSDVLPGAREDIPQVFDLYGRVASTGIPEKCETYVQALGIWLSITAYSSEPGHFVAVFDNITTRKLAESALRSNEEEFRTLAESMPQMVFVTRPDGFNLYFSRQWMDYTGLTLEESQGHGWNQPFHLGDQDRAWDAWLDATAQGTTYSMECRLRRSDGVYRWWLIRSVPMKDAGGHILKWIGTCTDIHDLKVADMEIARSNRVYAMLSGINALTVRAGDRDELLQEACRIAVEAGGFQMALIGVVEVGRGAIVPVASWGKDNELISAIGSLLSSAERAPNTLLAQAIREKKPIVCNDSRNDPRVLLQKHYEATPVRSIAILPLLVADQAQGALALYAEEVEFFHDDEMRLLTQLADDIAFCMGAIRERSERDLADEALRRSLNEKEALLKEVHHRVKNNMQVITSLLRLESNRIGHAVTKNVLKDMQNRIMAMAGLHEALYRSNDFSQVDLALYFRQLTDQLGRSLSAGPGKVTFHLDLLSIGLGLDQAIPCGLILNELVSNSLKHAFPAGRSGEVRVELRHEGESGLKLVVSDDGIGLPYDFEERKGKSLGLQLVSDLARQIGGALTIVSGPHTSFEVVFQPDRKERPSS
jgi:PAS domain S-box-containing protein